jgi:hypothetical protein
MEATPRLLQKFQEKKEADEQAYRMQELELKRQIFGARQNPYIDPTTGLMWNGTHYIKPPSMSGGIPPYSRAIARGQLNDKGEFDNNYADAATGEMAQVVTPAGKKIVVPWDAYQRSQGAQTQPATPPAVAAPPAMPGAAPQAPTAAPSDNERVRVIDPSGKAGTLPKSQVEKALEQGFKLG